ncbi:uncharacterized protein B0H64DRAFT_473534 [Chaetomium fimeti]|uniref:protein S-acyltransferase n=1 Tax=Chaetomium fimeti TaxID=1854472 RepID=A0AAE0LTY3_9PEZI|nr:hypothetical protein B0H64DRAFT_473534 [Chaetomium fimeti]
MSNPKKYTVGWICAIKAEYVAAQALLDRPQTVLPKGEYGTSSAAVVARDMLHTFMNIRFGLMVGIGGGAPSRRHDIRLGDVVVSSTANGNGGVYRYDFGKAIQDQCFQTTGFLNQPPPLLRTAGHGLEAMYDLDGNDLGAKITSTLEKRPQLRDTYGRPNPLSDRLYQSKVTHPPEASTASCEFTCGTGPSSLVLRPERSAGNSGVVVHYGLIASANQLMKDARTRDRLAEESDVLCFEMEAAGLMNHFPCLVIRGICDYSDSHKNKAWQGYAAMAAAAYAKDLLDRIRPSSIEAEQKLGHLIWGLNSKIEYLHEDVKAGFNHNNKKRNEILDWISPFDYGPQQTDHLKRRHPGTGQWLLDSDGFREWLGERAKTMFCAGGPGTGKTILTSIAIEDRQTRYRDDPSVAVAYIYCNDRRGQEQTLEALLGSLLKQLLQPLRSLPAIAEDLYDLHNGTQAPRIEGAKPLHMVRGPVQGGLPDAVNRWFSWHADRKTRPSLEELSRALATITGLYSRAFIVVDALDECQSANGCRPRLLSAVFNLQSQCGANFFATSRPMPEITDVFHGSIHLTVRAREEDVHKYLADNMSWWRPSIRKDVGLQEEIIDEISAIADGVFLLAHLLLGSLQDLTTVKALRGALARCRGEGHGQDGEILAIAYEHTMERVIEQKKGLAELAKKALQWIAWAKRPLRALELRHVLAVEADAAEPVEDCTPKIGDIVSVCAGLVIVDKRSGIVRLVHPTAQEYLEQTTQRWFPDAHRTITRACIASLTHGETHALYEYAVANWGHHAQAAGLDVEGDVMVLLGDNSIVSRCMCAQQAAVYSQLVATGSTSSPPFRGGGAGAVHLAACYGLVRALAALLRDGRNPDAKDSYHRTPLSYAAQGGHVDVVELLLAMDRVDPDSADGLGRTPLWWAANGGHEAVVRLLLDTGQVKPDSDQFVWPVLTTRSALGIVICSIALLPFLAWMLQESHRRHTPLSVAGRVLGFLTLRPVPAIVLSAAFALSVHGARRRPRGMERPVLLPRPGKTSGRGIARLASPRPPNGLDPDARDANGRTPLWWAANAGHAEVVSLLLASGKVDRDAADKRGWTPLSRAQLKKHGPVLELLAADGSKPKPKPKEANLMVHRTLVVVVLVVAQVLLLLLAAIFFRLRTLWMVLEFSTLWWIWGHLHVNRPAPRGLPYLAILALASFHLASHSFLRLQEGEEFPEPANAAKWALLLRTPVVMVMWPTQLAFGLLFGSIAKALIILLLGLQNWQHLLALKAMLVLPEPYIRGTMAIFPQFFDETFSAPGSLVLLILSGVLLLPILWAMVIPTLIVWNISRIARLVTKAIILGALVQLLNNTSMHSENPTFWLRLWNSLKDRGTAEVHPLFRLWAKSIHVPLTTLFRLIVMVTMLWPLWKKSRNGESLIPKVMLLLALALTLPVWGLWIHGVVLMHWHGLKLWRHPMFIPISAKILVQTSLRWAVMSMGRRVNGADSDGPEPWWETVTNWATRGDDPLFWLLIPALAWSSFSSFILGREQQTPLIRAAEGGHGTVIRRLLGAGGADPNFKSSDGETLLSIAARRGDAKLVDLLLKLGRANPNTRDYSGQTPLSRAAEGGHGAAVKKLLAQGVDPDALDFAGRTPLWRAAAKGHRSVVQLLLPLNGVDPNHRDSNGWDMVWNVIRKGGEPAPLVILLLQAYAFSTGRRTPLLMAAKRGHVPVVELLLADHRVSPDCRDYKGRTALTHASKKGCGGVVSLLLAREEVDPNSRDAIYGRTPMSYAAEKGHEAVVKTLLGRDGIEPDIPDDLGRTPLSYAAEKGHEGVVRLFLVAGGESVVSTRVPQTTETAEA